MRAPDLLVLRESFVVGPHLRLLDSPRTTTEATMNATILTIPCSTASVAPSAGPLLSGTRSATSFLSGRFSTWDIVKTSKDNSRLCILWLTMLDSLHCERVPPWALFPRWRRMFNRPGRGVPIILFRQPPSPPVE